ncbi:MAG: hypothetical protein ACM3PW_13655, partial [Chlamydiota bacterium]
DREHDVLQMSRRRGIWLFDYEDIKHKTPFSMFAWLVLGTGALAGGSAFLWLIIGRWSNNATLLSKTISLVIPGAMICYGIAFAPAGLIYFLRRRRGEALGMWDHERAKMAGESQKEGGSRS